ncbi:hypothetical protein FQN57_006066 [Myotisia sp. PD_48]|nr:hypothetical protein FQN57_006066 [Myotisia sp. PD_48]
MLPARPINRLLVANRGEIAVRILQAARELPNRVETFALYTRDDQSHCDIGCPDHALLIPSPSSYMDISLLVQLAKENSIDTIHPGYGFLSESPEFAQRMWVEAGVKVIGPGWEILSQTGDKLQAKELARSCGVPILSALEQPTNDLQVIRAAVAKIGYPIMIKAVDGGGGRGIRLVRSEDMLQTSVERAIGESPSRTVFVEKAAADGYHHVEVQIIGDGTGEVRHLWERDCSVQRRFQKIVECAPAMIRDRKLIGKVIDAAMRMAKKINYLSLGTFEFLVNEQIGEFYFLEVNPRLQVEHTITESITAVDLVQAQFMLALGKTLRDIGLGGNRDPQTPPGPCSIQLRLCAEDPSANFALSIGKITEFHVPGGNGVRVDTSISALSPVVIGSDFDNMVAKIIITAGSWESVVEKARRVLADTRISGVKTNIDVLRGIIGSADFRGWQISTQWLEARLGDIVQSGKEISNSIPHRSSAPSASLAQALSGTASSMVFRKGDAWSIDLQPLDQGPKGQPQLPHLLSVTRIIQNDFPSSLTAEIEYTTPTSGQTAAKTTAYKMTMATTTSTASNMSSSHTLGDPNDKSHLILPMSGKLIEVLVEEGDVVEENSVIAFVKQMKMEVEIRSPRAGIVTWSLELESEDGDDVPEGILLAKIEPAGPHRGPVEARGKL